jgi:Mrp family chromosome partitioning ATPase
LWLVPDKVTQEKHDSVSLHVFLGELRHEFEYSIVQGQPAGESSVTTEMAQIADGVVLVVSAERTRRAAACKIKEMLEAAQVRLLGAVLSDREFPIPERIYRRL